MSDHDGSRGATWRPSSLIQFSAGLHAAGIVALAAVPSRRPLIAKALILNHAILCAAGMLPRSRLLGANLSRLETDPRSQPRVALTFDDGPDPEITPQVLELLATYGAKASFFVIGRRAERHPGVLAEIIGRGHRLENHTYHHSNAFAFNGPRGLGREIDRAQRCLERLSGRRPTYFRAPAGMRNPWLDWVLARRRLKLASWTRRGFDTVDRRPRRVTRRLLRGLADGDVLLLHDGNAARGPSGRPVVLEVLPRVLDALAEHGLQGTGLPEPVLPKRRFVPLPQVGA